MPEPDNESPENNAHQLRASDDSNTKNGGAANDAREIGEADSKDSVSADSMSENETGAAENSVSESSTPQDAPDVLPIWASQTLMLLWLLLFGGRWLLVPVLQFEGLLAPAQLDMWDQLVLIKLYLVLLVTTIAVVALRAVRSAQSGVTSPQSASVQGASQADAPLPVASAGGDEALD